MSNNASAVDNLYRYRIAGRTLTGRTLDSPSVFGRRLQGCRLLKQLLRKGQARLLHLDLTKMWLPDRHIRRRSCNKKDDGKGSRACPKRALHAGFEAEIAGDVTEGDRAQGGRSSHATGASCPRSVGRRLFRRLAAGRRAGSAALPETVPSVEELAKRDLALPAAGDQASRSPSGDNATGARAAVHGGL